MWLLQLLGWLDTQEPLWFPNVVHRGSRQLWELPMSANWAVLPARETHTHCMGSRKGKRGFQRNRGGDDSQLLLWKSLLGSKSAEPGLLM